MSCAEVKCATGSQKVKVRVLFVVVGSGCSASPLWLRFDDIGGAES
jgi:hypothetical protein